MLYRVHCGINKFSNHSTSHKLESEWVGERVSERVNAAERSDANIAEHVKERAVRANERMDEQVAQYLRLDS